MNLNFFTAGFNQFIFRILTKAAKGASEIRIFTYPMRRDLTRITNHVCMTGMGGFGLKNRPEAADYNSLLKCRLACLKNVHE